MFAFFQKFLRNPGDHLDHAVQILTSDETKVTQTGQVATSLGGETVFSLNRKEALKLKDSLGKRRTSQKFDISATVEAAKRLSGYRPPSIYDEPVFAGRHRKDGYSVEKYFVKGEGDYIVPYLLLKPDKPIAGGILYLHPEGKSADASSGGSIEWFVRKGYSVLTPDIIGTGETGPGIFHGDAYIEGGSHNLFYGTVLIGRSIVGIRASDVVKLGNILKSECGLPVIYGVARREMSPVLVYAAAFDRSIGGIALIEPYSSYMSMVLNRFYISAFVPGAVPGAIREYDLPDLEASLAPGKLLLEGVTDGNGKRSDTDSINADLDVIRKVYSDNGTPDNLMIRDLPDVQNPENLFGEWIRRISGK